LGKKVGLFASAGNLKKEGERTYSSIQNKRGEGL